LEAMCHKQTDDGRVVYITCIPKTCCGEIFKAHNVAIAHVTLTTRGLPKPFLSVSVVADAETRP